MLGLDVLIVDVYYSWVVAFGFCRICLFCCVSWCFGGFLNLCLALIRGVVVCVVWCWFVLFVLTIGLDCRFDGSVVDLVLGAG